MPDRDKEDKGGYAEGGPGRGDYAGRGDGRSTEPQPEAEGELSERSRWRDMDPDAQSHRWDDKSDDALDPEVPEGGGDDAGEMKDAGNVKDAGNAGDAGDGRSAGDGADAGNAGHRGTREQPRGSSEEKG